MYSISSNDIESLAIDNTSERKRSRNRCRIITIIIIVLFALNITGWVLYVLETLKEDPTPEHMAEFEMNAIRSQKNTRFQFKLNPEFNVSSKVLKSSKDSFTWWKHREFCRDEVEKKSVHSYQVVENKLLTKKMFESQQFKDYAKTQYNADINELLKDLMPKRHYELTVDSNTNMMNEKKNFLDNICNGIIADTQSEFVYKPVHLAANAGVNMMNKKKWDEEQWTCEKLWNELEQILNTKVDEHYSVAKNQETNEALNPGIVIENKFPIFEGCGNGFPVAEIKIITLWGRVIQAVDACDHYKPVYRFRDGSFVIADNGGKYTATETDFKIQKSIDVHWEKIVRWSEIISNYVGADRLRIDWFHKYDKVQFNELGYPAANGHDSWNKMFSDMLYDGYKDNVYKNRESTKLVEM